MIKTLLLLTFSHYLLAQVIHSSASTYYENKTFKNSVQKENGSVYGFGADIHHNDSEFKLSYEQDTTSTKQPPLLEDLEIQKLFFKYQYQFDKKFALHVNYLGILKDNLAETDGGIAFGGGMTYTFNKKFALNITEYYTDYEYFDVFQSDLRLDYKMKINKIKMTLSSISKYISTHKNEDERDQDTPNFMTYTKSYYFTSGLKLQARYEGYHFGVATFFGKRAFAIMDDGFKIQHDAMEFDRTYAIGAGVNIYDFVVRTQYIYQRAKELPDQNENVKVHNLRFIANYKF